RQHRACEEREAPRLGPTAGVGGPVVSEGADGDDHEGREGHERYREDAAARTEGRLAEARARTLVAPAVSARRLSPASLAATSSRLAARSSEPAPKNAAVAFMRPSTPAARRRAVA